MSDPLVRLQRLVDRVIDGELVSATELATVAPLFGDPPPVDIEALAARIGTCGQPEGRLPAGQLVLGPAGEPRVTWPCASDGIAVLLARAAEAVALLHCAQSGELLPALAAQLGLEADLLVELARGTTVTAVASESALEALLPGDERWRLLICQGVPAVDVVAPYLRDVAGSVATFAAGRGLSLRDDDAAYGILDAMLASDPRLHDERAAQEARCGVRRGTGGVVRVDPAALDLAAADLRLRNALTALRRDCAPVLIAPADRSVLQTLARSCPRPPERVLIATRGVSTAPGVWRPAQLGHVEGHRLTLDLDGEDPLAAGLPRELGYRTQGLQVAVPAWSRLRPDVQATALQGADALDDGAYAAALACRLLGLDGRAGAGQLVCACADATSAVGLALALWRALVPGARRPARRR